MVLNFLLLKNKLTRVIKYRRKKRKSRECVQYQVSRSKYSDFSFDEIGLTNNKLGYSFQKKVFTNCS